MQQSFYAKNGPQWHVILNKSITHCILSTISFKHISTCVEQQNKVIRWSRLLQEFAADFQNKHFNLIYSNTDVRCSITYTLQILTPKEQQSNLFAAVACHIIWILIKKGNTSLSATFHWTMRTNLNRLQVWKCHFKPQRRLWAAIAVSFGCLYHQ